MGPKSIINSKSEAISLPTSNQRANESCPEGSFIIVYKTEPEGEFHTRFFPNSTTAQQIDALIGVNWYGSGAKDTAGAVNEAIKSGFKYRSAQEMSSLVSKAKDLSTRVAARTNGFSDAQ